MQPGGWLTKLADLLQRGGYTHEVDVDLALRKRYGDYGTLEEGLERYLTEEQPSKAIRTLVDSRQKLVQMAQEACGGLGLRSEEASDEEIVGEIMSALGVPRSPSRHELRGCLAMRDELQASLDALTAEGEPTPAELRKYAMEAWACVESVLKLTIRFYSHVLASYLDDEFRELFQLAARKRSLGPILRAMRSVEQSFIPRADLGNPVEPAVEEAKTRCRRVLDRETPFRDFDFGGYESEIDWCRNFYAHSASEEIARVGVSGVCDSIDVALRLIDDLRKQHIAPELIVPTGLCTDAHGRKVIWFLREHQTRQDVDWSRLPANQTWFYSDWQRTGLQLLRPRFCPTPVRRGTYEPATVEATEVRSDAD
jgi:hypothetical protein